MSLRHRAREAALQVLYRLDIATPAGTPMAPLSSQELIAEFRNHFEHFDVPEDSREFAAQLTAGCLASLQVIDAVIESHASNWKLARMAFVDRSLLRLATYELTSMKETPASVVIDEAVELGKKFGTAESSAFVNGVLDAIRASVEAGKISPSR